MKYIDIHAHLTFEDYNSDREDVLARMSESEVEAINVGVDLESSREVVNLAESRDGLYSIVGLHPLYVITLGNKEKIKSAIAELAYLATSSTVVGIGECGLDFFRLGSDIDGGIESEKKLQEYAFRLQIELAVSLNKPIMIHCRDAYPEVLEILKEYKDKFGDALRVNFHFFAGDAHQLKEIINLGFYVSFTGVVTFAKDYLELVKAVPEDRIMAETDCPYVAPIPYRGKRNEPSFVIEVVNKIAEIRGESEEKIRIQILENTKKFFIDFS